SRSSSSLRSPPPPPRRSAGGARSTRGPQGSGSDGCHEVRRQAAQREGGGEAEAGEGGVRRVPGRPREELKAGTDGLLRCRRQRVVQVRGDRLGAARRREEAHVVQEGDVS
ncbi:unnamed protein product, partial [Linum tenue]